jgi:hypothetical protein
MNIFGVVDLFQPNATTTSAAIATTRMPELLKYTKRKPGNGAFVLDDGDHAAPRFSLNTWVSAPTSSCRQRGAMLLDLDVLVFDEARFLLEPL